MKPAMSRSQFSRLSLCAAAIGALAMTAFAIAPLRAAGVVNAVSGYAGGSKMTADYHMVSTGTTGHAESVQIKYDPKQISYGKILQIFFSVAHDPTQLNRQGPDSGTQYRSALFTSSDEQKK